MIQQINFYSQLKKPPKFNLNFEKFKQISIAFSILLVLLYLGNMLYYFWQQHALIELINQRKANEQQLAALNHYYATSLIKPLRWQNQILQTELETKQALLKQTQLPNIDTNFGYSLFLAAFAKNITPGVWLTHIVIEQASQQVILSGSAINNANILQFMQNLNNQYLFKGKNLRLIDLKNAGQVSDMVNFTLSTKAPEENGSTIKKTP